ncbi:MAG: hypothetical protein K2P58_01345 [Hyphomonadaceae bacterium]|nr:hypothetical protein [Hyphomonadaceae bacterium]
MASVVIIHAADDALPSRALAEKLRQAGAQVTLDRAPGGETQAALAGAAAAIALWSPRSVAQAALIADAEAARVATQLVHATMQSASVPASFAGEPAVNLTGWRGEDDFAPWRQLAAMIMERIGAPPPQPTPRPSFLKAAPPSPPQKPAAPTPTPMVAPAPALAPTTPAEPARTFDEDEPARAGASKTLLIAAAALVAVGVIGGGGYWIVSQNSADTTALEDIDISSAAELRAFIASTRSSDERQEAQAALRQLEEYSLDAARDANTIEAFETFLQNFPNSEERVFVQGQIQQLRLREAQAPQGVELGPATTTTELPAGVDPDLLPPDTTFDPATTPPNQSGPVPLTVPPTEEPAPAPPPT